MIASSDTNRAVREIVGASSAFLLLLLVGVPIHAADGGSSALLAEDGWELVIEDADLRIHRRFSQGSNVVEAHASARIAAPVLDVLAVLTDQNKYPEFMPHIIESRILSEQGGTQLIFQRLRISETFRFLISDRYHVVRNRVVRSSDGKTDHRIEWALDEGATREHFVRDAVPTRLNSGYWVLEDTDGSETTRIRYYLKADPGGWIPQAFANTGTVQSIPAVVAAVRRRVLWLSSSRESR